MQQKQANFQKQQIPKTGRSGKDLGLSLPM